MRPLIPLAFAAIVAQSVGAQSALHFSLSFGPHAVGFRAVEQYDYSRSFVGEFDDGQARTSERSRPMQISIWYPAAATNAARMQYRDYLELNVAPGTLPSHDAAIRRVAASRLARAFAPADTARLARELASVTHAVRDAAPAAGSFPVVVYGPSFNAPSFENALLMEYLASYGYIVISSPSTGAQGSQTTDAAGLETEARDMEFLIGYARSVPEADMTRLAVMGFSWGGLANVLVALRNPSVRALVSLDGSIAYFYHRMFAAMPFVDPAHFTVPALFLKQRTLAPPARAGMGADSVFDFFTDLRYSDAYLVTLGTIAHQNFGEWFDRLQQRDGQAFVADTIVQRAGYERIALYARNFLDAYVLQSNEALAFLARSPAENGLPSGEVGIQRKHGMRPLPTIVSFVHELGVQHQTPASAPELLRRVRQENPSYSLDETAVNAWGYRLLAAKQPADAIGVFRINATMHPTSANTHDSLGEAYLAHGDTTEAIRSYERSLALDSTNTSAAARLKSLKAR